MKLAPPVGCPDAAEIAPATGSADRAVPDLSVGAVPLAGGALLHRLLLALLRLAAALARAALRRLPLLGGRSTAWCALTLRARRSARLSAALHALG